VHHRLEGRIGHHLVGKRARFGIVGGLPGQHNLHRRVVAEFDRLRRARVESSSSVSASPRLSCLFVSGEALFGSDRGTIDRYNNHALEASNYPPARR
jgi:hypothetical protein